MHRTCPDWVMVVPMLAPFAIGLIGAIGTRSIRNRQES